MSAPNAAIAAGLVLLASCSGESVDPPSLSSQTADATTDGEPGGDLALPITAPHPSFARARPARASASASAAPPAEKPADSDRYSFARVKKAQAVDGRAPAGGFAASAASCLAEASCSIERYAGLLLAAVDADEPVSCFQLVDGIGVPVDLDRARKCLGAAVTREGDCGKSSPSLERLQLSLLIATGRGGPRSSAAARVPLQNCFQDGSVSAIDSVIVGLEKGNKPSLDSLQVCDAGLAGTTLHMSACMMLEVDYLDVRESALEKALLTTFDAPTLDAFRKAAAENREYATLYAESVADMVRGGTMAQTLYPGAILTARSARLLRWELLARGVLTDAPDPKQARADVLTKRDAARAMGDAMFKGRFAKMEKAYAAYRAEEAPLFKKLPRMTAARVDALLDAEWTRELDSFGEL